jgi:hypothetical protein
VLIHQVILQFYPYNIFQSVVDFTNILRTLFCTKVSRAAFFYLHLRFVIFMHKNLGAKNTQKCWWNWHQDSISSLFYECICANFLETNKKFHLYLKHKKSFAQNICTKKPCVKCWWNWLVHFLASHPFQQYQLMKCIFPSFSKEKLMETNWTILPFFTIFFNLD